VIERLKRFGLLAGRKKKSKGGGDDGNSGSSGRAIPKEVWNEPLLLVPRGGMSTGREAVIRKVRLTKPELSIVPLRRDARAFVKPGSLHHVAIFEINDPKGKVRREAVFVSMLEAARRVRDRQPVVQRRHPAFPEAVFVMSLCRGEMVLGTFKGEERLVYFSTAASTQGQLYFIDHRDARPSASVEKYAVMANTLRGRKVFVDVLGRLRAAKD
jgi:hypothetical protein